MGKETKALYAKLTQMLDKQMNTPPPVNKAQEYLTNQSLQAAKDFETSNFATLPKNMFMNFQRPAEQRQQRELLMNAGTTGTFGLADAGGQTASTRIQNEYLKDRFARDTSQNFQDNIGAAAANIQNALANASGAEAGRIAWEDQRMMGVTGMLSNLYQFKKQTNQQGNLFGTILGAGAQVAGAALTGGAAITGGAKP